MPNIAVKLFLNRCGFDWNFHYNFITQHRHTWYGSFWTDPVRIFKATTPRGLPRKSKKNPLNVLAFYLRYRTYAENFDQFIVENQFNLNFDGFYFLVDPIRVDKPDVWLNSSPVIGNHTETSVEYLNFVRRIWARIKSTYFFRTPCDLDKNEIIELVLFFLGRYLHRTSFKISPYCNWKWKNEEH